MDATHATADQDEAIRDVAGRSIRASYSLSPEQITALVEQEFGDERLERRRDGDDELLLVSEDDGEVVGFVTGFLDAERESGGAESDGVIDWLFVAPEARGQEIGTELWEAASEELEERGAETVRAHVLSENEEGGQFFEQFGWEPAGNLEFEIDEETYAVEVYGPEGEEANEELHKPDTVDTDDGTVYTGDEELSGKEAPFLVLYTDEDRTEQYGFFCTNCGTLANAADGLERVDCDTCGNESRPEEWDGSYL